MHLSHFLRPSREVPNETRSRTSFSFFLQRLQRYNKSSRMVLSSSFSLKFISRSVLLESYLNQQYHTQDRESLELTYSYIPGYFFFILVLVVLCGWYSSWMENTPNIYKYIHFITRIVYELVIIYVFCYVNLSESSGSYSWFISINLEIL